MVRQPSSVAVAVPAQTLELSSEARQSLHHLRTYLGSYDTFAVLPHGLSDPLAGLPVKRFAVRFFRSTRSYSRLLLSDAFYGAFSGYEYVLVHQLDCLVFSDELSAWCERGYDYVGAPWTRRTPSGEPFFTDVGNGGLSLRRVESCRRVLARRSASPFRRARERLKNPWPFEDKFWSLEAPRLDTSFRIPSPEVAVSFSFETEPRFCFEANGRRLPFGCHRWMTHDPEFWRPYLLPDAVRAT
jgi:uncharacterized protein DUF5672